MTRQPPVLEQPPYTVTQECPNVHTIRFPDVRAGWEQWVLLRSDAHHDSVYCDRAFETAHLEEAKTRRAIILDFGDCFDAMQGRHDHRRSAKEVRPAYARPDYYDSLVETAIADYAPYAPQFAVLTRGNHEMGVLKHSGTDLTDRLVAGLRRTGALVYAGGYGGWIRFMFKTHRTVNSQLRLKYFHGSGGGGPVTRGVIQTNRQAVYLPDADVVVNGHTHDAWLVPIQRERLSGMGAVHQDKVWYVRTPGYKDEYADGEQGWAVERGAPPKPIGAVWMRLFLESAREGRIGAQFLMALR